MEASQESCFPLALYYTCKKADDFIDYWAAYKPVSDQNHL